MQKMPELVQLRDQLEIEGLVVLGVNFDEDPATARAAIAEKGLTWPQVHAKSAAKGDEDLWEEITGITTLPRLLLIDKQGVLRDDFYPMKLHEHVEPLLGEEAKTAPGR